jgi:hypothetical protein
MKHEMAVKLIEIEPNKWRVERREIEPARSDLPRPYIISDDMPPTEQVDGIFYSSKSKFRAVGKQLGLVEIGNEKPKPKTRASTQERAEKARREAIGKAVAQYKAGRRVQTNAPEG